MTSRAQLDTFRDRLRETFVLFGKEEEVHWTQWASSNLSPVAQAEILERATRRYLIDPLLRALDWSPDDPTLVTEERRSWSDKGDPLYFDYLGGDGAHNPLLLFEAKGADAPAPRPAGASADEDTARRGIAATIGALSRGEKPSVLLKAWTGWLGDLRGYVLSLPLGGRERLKRVAITSGRWLVVIDSPAAVFTGGDDPETSLSHVFLTEDDILAGSDRVYALLHRSFLADTLPLALSQDEAIALLIPTSITHLARGVIVRTRPDGFQADAFVRRVAAPVVILVSGGRAFAVRESGGRPMAEPEDSAALPKFLDDLDKRGDLLEAAVRRHLDIAAHPLTTLAAFPPRALEAPAMPVPSPVSGSTASRSSIGSADRRVLARSIPYRDSPPEYVVVTGTTWFYKLGTPTGADCELHDWLRAQARQSAEPHRHLGQALTSFTASGDPQHCADAPMKGHRQAVACHVAQLETHLCCRACIFDEVCWAGADRARLSCPPVLGVEAQESASTNAGAYRATRS